jgi:hypothetical protein
VHAPQPSFDRVVWIGGGTGGGKTTAARLLAVRHGLRAFHVDSFWYAHDVRLGLPELDPDEQWLRRTPARQAREFEQRARLATALVLEDLAALPPEPPIVVEGPQVFPDLLQPRARAVFLIPTPDFQRTVLSPRLMPSSDPVRALANRLEKDRLYADRVAERARACGFPTIVVDGTRTPEELVAEIERLVDFPEGSGDLREARRWENEAVAANLRSWISSRQGPGERTIAYPFACECGARGCAERVELTLDEYAARASVLAH